MIYLVFVIAEKKWLRVPQPSYKLFLPQITQNSADLLRADPRKFVGANFNRFPAHTSLLSKT
jgi:hypothetical protein